MSSSSLSAGGEKKLSVAIIHPDLGIGGAERLIVDAAVELSAHGHDVHIFTAHHDKNRCFEETVSDLLLARHTTLLRKIYRKPIDLIEEATTGLADLILVNSKFTASTFANTFRHLHSRRIEPDILYPAVNVLQFDEACDYKMNFLSINRFERKKNIQLAISAFAILKSFLEDDLSESRVKATLTLAGGYDRRLKENVEYLRELEKLAEDKGVLGEVNFVTSCSTAERNALLSQCICVIYTPKDEHFGIVPLEAMAASKPVIACNSGGPMETIKHGVTGFLCDPTPREFALVMHKFIDCPELAERMGKEARRHVTESFSTKKFGETLNQFVLDAYHRRIE